MVNYILTNLVEEKEMGENEDILNYARVKKLIMDNPNSYKTKMIEIMASKNEYDKIIEYLIEIYPLLRKRRLTEEEIEKIKPYDELMEKIEKETL